MKQIINFLKQQDIKYSQHTFRKHVAVKYLNFLNLLYYLLLYFTYLSKSLLFLQSLNSYYVTEILEEFCFS